MTMNSPESLTELHRLASGNGNVKTAIMNAETMREVGLKCMGFNGVPRTINCLNAFRSSLSEEVGRGLTIKPSRMPSSENIEDAKKRGHTLWNSIYRPFETKLVEKLAYSHPDLPVHIINSEYGLLFADPPRDAIPGQRVGRIATSVVAVACLRAQTGVGPQVTSHLFGLRKALDDGTWKEDVQNEDGARWLASDEGGIWILESVDKIVEAIGRGEGSTFAPTTSKL
ncbi:mitochondrial protein [Zopfia rhizophila CBS 207.26]|uniref:Mitochondrial protein n=1 Tax=Zopfia rhizophila CBS 207.26 TaxID=1314779 RepID=A0A6A6DVK2_9PEZI|nr:mitochondrial protein [Zopfia rhizophila CBS 207.26]